MFEHIIGNDNIKQNLEDAIKLNKIAHSYLFIGIKGIGKKMIAKDFAKKILCLNENKYCNNCKSCIRFETNNNPDFSIIEPDGNSIKIEQIREMQRKIQEKPIISTQKIYLIDDADCMTKEAQNCLLKTLEEPPKFAKIILIGSNEQDFLSTIKSRCIILHFNKISDKLIKEYLEKQYGMKNINQDILDMFQGSIGKAIQLKQKIDKYQEISRIIDDVEKKDIIEILNEAEIIYNSKEEIFDILDYINVILLKKAKINYKYVYCMEIIEQTKKRLRQNANYNMSIDNMLFNIWEKAIED